MKKLLTILISIVVVCSVSIPTCAQEPAFHRTSAQKGVKTSTDVIALALPASALIGTLCLKDWKGLVQGVETAAVTAALTVGLKYAIKEKRPDGSNMHSFPSGHSAVSFASAAYLQIVLLGPRSGKYVSATSTNSGTGQNVIPVMLFCKATSPRHIT